MANESLATETTLETVAEFDLVGSVDAPDPWWVRVTLAQEPGHGNGKGRLRFYLSPDEADQFADKMRYAAAQARVTEPVGREENRKAEVAPPNEAKIPTSACPTCGFLIYTVTSFVDEDTSAEPGGAGSCANCGELLVFESDLRLRRMTDEETDALPDAQFLRMTRTEAERLAMCERRNGFKTERLYPDPVQSPHLFAPVFPSRS